MRILSKSGESLADVYDVEGSIAGITDLQSKDVNLVHEMGSTIFAERFGGTLFRQQTGAINQSTTFDLVINTLPVNPARILGIQVFVDADRVNICTVNIHDRLAGQDMPIWAWDAAGGTETNVRVGDDGNAAAGRILLLPSRAFIATMLQGTNSKERVEDVILRGDTAAFGAGTVNIVLIMHIAFVQVGGISSRGLPIPSW